MGVSRSGFDAEPAALLRDEAIVAGIRAVTDQFEGCGHRRVGVELRHRGDVVNAGKVRRLRKAHDPAPRPRRRFVRTADGDHDGPTFPLVAGGFEVRGPDRLRLADLICITIAAGFADVAVVPDAGSRRVVGDAIGRSIDARLSAEALRRAIATRRRLPGWAFRSDRGSRHAAGAHRALLAERGFVGSMSRRGNPCDDPQDESFMQILKGEDARPADCGTLEDVAVGVTRFVDVCDRRRLRSASGCPGPVQFEEPTPAPRQDRRLSRSA